MKRAWAALTPDVKLEWGRHLDCFCEHLQACVPDKEGKYQISNLLVNCPPGSTKSITFCVMFPVWAWIKQPNLQFLTASSDLKVSVRDADQSRKLIESDWHRNIFGKIYQLSQSQNVKNWYKNNKNGHRLTVSVGSAIVGKKGDVLIVDDPNDTNKVQSEADRQKAIGWHDTAFWNRVNHFKKCCRMYIGQRTHDNDLFGHLLDKFKKSNIDYQHITLPEEFDSKRNWVTVLGWSDWRKEEGEFLRPERFSQEQKREAIAFNGARHYQTQHNQNPLPDDGSVFKRANFRYYTREFGRWRFGHEVYNEEQLFDRFLTVDHASTLETVDKPSPDYTVISAWCRTPGGHLCWLGCSRFRCEAPEIPLRIGQSYLRFRADRALIESGGPQNAVYQLTRKHQPSPGFWMNCIPYETKNRDKLSRSIPAQNLFDAGKIWMPKDDPAFPLGDVESELIRFTGNSKRDLKDDIVDTLSQAAEYVQKKEMQRVGVGGKKMYLYPIRTFGKFWKR